ncbi:ABC transporter ATP-binding protein [Tianweitania sp.]|uniref:ABC transporter ATP-binding protein n=1 Tax=Tianweitania sp. TaxID=2021634 RepID=UPI0028A02820|nr:ABC transporter ATP-binding protein [Tianweitania sp.]
MSDLALDHVVKRYGGLTVVKDVSLAIAEGEFVSLLGPSGCGKTTILRMVAGLIEPSDGTIRIGTAEVTRLPPNKRNIGLVFQSYALFPHMTVFENVAFGLRRKGQSGATLETRVNEALSMVRLAGYADRYPRQLSGGQQQRIAIARAIAPRPSVLLFDEPLSNLDAKLRDEMQIELKRLQRELGITTLFVTHDQSEALSLSDRVCVMNDGVIQQFAAPEDIYRRPATAFVASFIGKPNRLKATVKADRLVLGEGLELSTESTLAADGESVDVFIRQEAISLTPSGAGDANRIPGTVALRSFSGPQVQYVIRIAGDHELVVEAASSGPASHLEQAQPVTLEVRPQDVLVIAQGAHA